ncbi:MAG: G5 domain-containing protein [Anaerolineae bacterium]|nr:G5 domain-containing protein [Anaerolineae bacterium]
MIGLAAAFAMASACAAPPALPSPHYRITLVADGVQQVIETETASTVQGLLTEAGIELGELDRVQPPEVAALADMMTVRVTRVEVQTHVLTQTVPFGRQVVRDAAVPEGENRLLQVGQAGLLERYYRVTIEDHVERERVLAREVLVQSPQPEIRLIGARPQPENVVITGTLAYLANQDAWVIRESSFQRRRTTALGDLDGRVFSLSPDAQVLLFSRTVTESEHINELWLVRTTEASPNPVPLNVRDVLWADWLPVRQPAGRSIAWTTAEVADPAPGWRGLNDLWVATVTDRSTLTARRQVLHLQQLGLEPDRFMVARR